ncbi:hypothetical protein IE81DRAFT_329844 [Ceraceosorus guamensis]|uniref:Uncharacterized protein n=1 Tax=Ceraceosorus guamensis TaxID=1522189 RepID=A0A316VZB0_9BASI|nr:hypothetical protein IE81DRAFT_329844 [Ceraceosorus guamensis]PWN43007.1 hypothetical protein IE81DRAFT_329844 [Ceraceosorus guamensis]
MTQKLLFGCLCIALLSLSSRTIQAVPVFESIVAMETSGAFEQLSHRYSVPISAASNLVKRFPIDGNPFARFFFPDQPPAEQEPPTKHPKKECHLSDHPNPFWTGPWRKMPQCQE